MTFDGQVAVTAPCDTCTTPDARWLAQPHQAPLGVSVNEAGRPRFSLWPRVIACPGCNLTDEQP